jgi:ribosomal protein S18 acetylase RimI-like enzyme
MATLRDINVAMNWKVEVKKIPGQVCSFYIKDGKVTVSSMLVSINTRNDQDLTAMIHNIVTSTAYRNQGFATRLVNSLKDTPRMRYIFTSYFDSTMPGRNLMQKCGFYQWKGCLVWDSHRQ